MFENATLENCVTLMEQSVALIQGTIDSNYLLHIIQWTNNLIERFASNRKCI